MTKRIRIIIKSEATEEDWNFWGFLNNIQCKTMNSDIEALEVENLVELSNIEKRLKKGGWSKVVSDTMPPAFSSPYRPCVTWEQIT